ncbi:MAG: 50S ribosomal protein L18 [Aigarchaeota archaeon]|nr:50S ribosomal protein L18 [Aigarchaeota archaeon]MCX8193078.1 50S ribosomal protein L18 [Nitrososphaeria archaeon]MDW7986927.1 50S ribosomal protein L18 [Nitrososphaerota archaeon]
MSRLKTLKRVPPRRRREGLTDYRARLKLVKSGLPRLVIRKSNRYIQVQIVKSKAGGDETLLTVTSKHLLKYGWRAGTKNLSAAYLTGLLTGVLAKKKNIEKAIVDIGLYTPIKGSRIFAVVKGVIDAGVEVPVSEEKLPEDERIKGEHIEQYYQMIKNENVKTIQFSKSLEEVYRRFTEHFTEIKEKILKEVDVS